MNILDYIFAFLIFPGFVFSVTAGLLIGWVDRKVTARVQWRKGPPWYQNFLDIFKLFYKETLLPEGSSKVLFLAMPIIALSGVTLASTIIFGVNLAPQRGFIGDLIVVIYLLMIPSLALMLGGFASANPLASLGASREMKLVLSYELPFIVSLLVPIIKSGYSIRLGDMLIHQLNNGAVIGSLSGALSFMCMLICVQAKLGLLPFDVAEAETEIISGPYIEYSGAPLAFFKLSKAVAYFAAPLFMVTLYLGEILKSIVGFFIILVLMILIKNTNPRVRIDQAMRFFWKPVTAIAIISVMLAYLGY